MTTIENQPLKMESKDIGDRKRRFKPFGSLRSWWKRRRLQYLLYVNVPEERIGERCREKTEISESFRIGAPESFIAPLAFHLEDKISFGVNSFHDSIESMDSIIGSHYTHSEEEVSESTEFVEEFLMEHLNFLSQSTQPQEVELVYNCV